MSINKVVISGNLTRDPEVRNTAGGMAILSFAVACNDRRKNASGAWEDVPNYFDCTVFGARGESLGRILKKGMKVCVAGKLHWSQWEKDGQKRSRVDIIADDVELMQQRGESQGAAVYDEEIPF